MSESHLAIDRFGWSQPLFYNVSLKHMRLHPEFVAAVNAIASPRHDVYEFGVYTGSRIKELSERIHGFGHMWGWIASSAFRPRLATPPDRASYAICTGVQGAILPPTR